MIELSEQMALLLSEAADAGCVIQIDDLFSRLTIGIICKIAFQYDLNALDDSETYNALHSELNKLLEVR